MMLLLGDQVTCFREVGGDTSVVEAAQPERIQRITMRVVFMTISVTPSGMQCNYSIDNW